MSSASDPVIESRRFRTWDESRAMEADHRIALLIKAQFLRYQKSWLFWVVFGIAVLGAIGALMAPFSEMDWRGWVSGSDLAFGYFIAAGQMLAVAALLFGSPSVAEDLRFNAPLFYFSRPVRVWDYVLAKVGFVMALLSILVGMSLATGLLGALLTIGGEVPPKRDWMSDSHYQDSVANWGVAAINSFGDWLFLALIGILGTFSIIAFLATTTVAVSSFTKRAWHAGVGLIVVLGATGFIGLGLGFVASDTAYQFLWGPFGWMGGVSVLPIEAYFSESSAEYLDGAPAVAVLSHIFLIGWSLAALRITYARVSKLEGAL